MKTNKFSILAYAVGAIWIILSLWRWTIFYSELKESVIFVCLGFTILGFAYLYQRVSELKGDAANNKVELKEDLDGLGRSVEALKKWSVDEIEKLKQ